ncbi:MAG: DUF108 domain-containing protein [Candidatus Bathyarchaeota archaeon]|nr:DUF108 domain-containing protein [Candidatus Bathyarchaeota archaeon]
MRAVGLIGCGAIGTVLAEAIERRIVVCDELILFDLDKVKAERLKNSLAFPTTIVSSFEDLLKLNPVIIVEAASQDAAKTYVPRIVAAGINVIVMSSGALLDLNLDLTKVHVPSGAIGGIDSITSALLAGEVEVALTTTKNPKALETQDKKPKVIYEGEAREAARLFPREMNVAATLALVVKPAKVKVTVIADPNTRRNTHKITVKWQFGEMLLQFANDPHPDNPRTSALAAWSAIKLLQNLLKQ